MSKQENETADLEKARDIITQLKDIHHYSKANIEKLSAFWLLFEDEMHHKDNAKRTEKLISLQTNLHEELEALISDYEIECNRIENEAS